MCTNIENLPKVIPIFPLSNCLLLPNGNLALNIFEPRYINMTEDSISNNRLIGMVQPKKTNTTKIELYNIKSFIYSYESKFEMNNIRHDSDMNSRNKLKEEWTR